MTLREKIAELLAVRFWSRAQLARKAGMSTSALQRIVSGGLPNVTNGIALAKALDVPVEWLFDDKLGWNGLLDLPFWWPPDVKHPGGLEAGRGRHWPADDPAQRAVEEARTADEAVEAALRAEGVTLPPVDARPGARRKPRRAADGRPRKRA